MAYSSEAGINRLGHRRSWLGSWLQLIRWSMIRYRHLLPAFTLIQVLFAVAIVYGLALLIADITIEVARYLSSGAWTLGIIAVGCALAPQIIGTSKQEGFLDYQRTLPVPRSAILLADAGVWAAAALPGIAAGMVAAVVRFNLVITVDIWTVVSLIYAQFTMIFLGFSIALWLPYNATALLTQVIMIGGLLFSPITFPAERLSEWAAILHQFLPFAPLSSIIREAAFRVGEPQGINIIVVAIWAAATCIAGYFALRRRN